MRSVSGETLATAFFDAWQEVWQHGDGEHPADQNTYSDGRLLCDLAHCKKKP
jgi:hypothetical protein